MIANLISAIIPWLLPGVLILSFIVNFTGKWEKGSGDGSKPAKKGKDSSQKESKEAVSTSTASESATNEARPKE